MALPRADVASAFVESYINSRSHDWGINNKQQVIATDKIPADKKRACISLLNQIKVSHTYEDWLNFIYFCDTSQREQIAKFQNRFGYFTSLIAKLFEKLHLVDKDSLLVLYIHAAQTYAFSILVQNEKFIQTQADLIKQKEEKQLAINDANSRGLSLKTKLSLASDMELINQKIESLKHSKDYATEFFKDKIKDIDPKAIELDEKSLDDFQENVKSGKRSLNMCKMLVTLAAQEKQNQDDKNKPAEKTEVSQASLVTHSTFARKRDPIENKADSDNKQQSNETSHRYPLRNRPT